MYSKKLRSLKEVQASVIRVNMAAGKPAFALGIEVSCVQGSHCTMGRRHRPKSSSSWGLGAAARTSEGSIRQPGAWEGWCSQIERRHGICMVQLGLLNACKKAFVADTQPSHINVTASEYCRLQEDNPV